MTTPTYEIRLMKDVRRHEAFLSQAVSRMLVRVQAEHEDVAGVLALGWVEVAAQQAWGIMMECASIRNILRGGLPTWKIDDAGFNPLRYSPEDEVERASSIVARGWELRHDTSAAPTWLADLGEFIAETEDLLELGEALPILRSPDGMFSVLRILREEQGLITAFGLPSVIPRQWDEL